MTHSASHSDASATQLAPRAESTCVRQAAAQSLGKRAFVEGVGTAYLTLTVIGSGILGQRLTDGQAPFILLVSALATAAALYALIRWLAPLSGAHFNPLISVALFGRGALPIHETLAYVAAQTCGAMISVVCAHGMFDLPPLEMSQTVRHGSAIWLSEFVATFGLVAITLSFARRNAEGIASVVACYVGAAFWFTQTDFVNPALTLARAFTDSFAGIRLSDVPGFWLAQAAGAIAALLFDHYVQNPGGGAGLPSR